MRVQETKSILAYGGFIYSLPYSSSTPAGCPSQHLQTCWSVKHALFWEMRKQEEKLKHFLDHWTPAGGWLVITTNELCCDNDKVLLSSLLSCKNWGSWKWGSARGMCWACELYLSVGPSRQIVLGMVSPEVSTEEVHSFHVTTCHLSETALSCPLICSFSWTHAFQFPQTFLMDMTFSSCTIWLPLSGSAPVSQCSSYPVMPRAECCAPDRTDQFWAHQGHVMIYTRDAVLPSM